MLVTFVCEPEEPGVLDGETVRRRLDRELPSFGWFFSPTASKLRRRGDKAIDTAIEGIVAQRAA